MANGRSGWILLLALGLPPLILAEDVPSAPVDEMRRQAALIQVDSISEDRTARAGLSPNPLLRYSDPARNVADGSLWAFGNVGRPVAILEVENYPRRPEDARWLHGLVSLSPARIAATWDDGHRWSSTRPGLVLKPVADSPAPAATERGRLRQMKTLAQRFGFREDAGPERGKIQLRLLPNPIYRYADSALGLQDGAIFAFAFGTNPEALLILESRSSGRDSPSWQYGLARITGGALAVDLAGHEVWTQGEANPPYSGAVYMNRRHAILTNSR